MDCEIPSDLRLGEEGRGADGAKSAFPIARVLAALQALRIAEAALAAAADYAHERFVHGRRLAERSLIQDGYGDFWGRIQSARLLAYRVAADLSRGDTALVASAVKAIAAIIGKTGGL